MGSDMNELEKLQADLLTLPVNSRATLARALIESLDEATDENSEALWVDEIRRRDEELRSGRASARPVNDVLRDARERLRCMK
jgi:putative addiction module component (TIGR02574 family)